jgi:hypothetical protein
MTRRRGNMTDLDSALNGLLGRLDRKNSGAWTAAKVAVLWADVAGPIVNAHTTGVHLRDGTLVVYVDSHARANDLSALSERYRVAMNSGLGKESVKKVSFTVSRKVSDERRLQVAEEETAEFYREDDVEPVPLTPTERAQVEASAAGIPDERLREAVIRATVKDLEWKRGIAQRNSREEPRDGV